MSFVLASSILNCQTTPRLRLFVASCQATVCICKFSLDRRQHNRRISIIGQRFVRPELQWIIALYGIHFAVWVPISLRLSPPAFLAQFLLIIAPLAVCYGIPAAWLGVSYAIRESNPMSHGEFGFLLTVHLCLLAFTLLCIVMRVTGIGF